MCFHLLVDAGVLGKKLVLLRAFPSRASSKDMYLQSYSFWRDMCLYNILSPSLNQFCGRFLAKFRSVYVRLYQLLHDIIHSHPPIKAHDNGA